MKKLFKSVGISLIVISIISCLLIFAGFLKIDNFEILGHSGIRSIAAIAVMGCLLAAIGYHD